MNQEFFLSVTPVRENEYWVRTERVSPGVPLAEELVTWEVESWLEQARQLMDDPLLGLLRGNLMRTGQAPDDLLHPPLSANLVEFGQTLYNALFQGTIRDSWMTAQGIAQNRREGLRLRLGLKGEQLPRLPWEVLHAGIRPLATGTDVVFSRYQASMGQMATVLNLHRSPMSDTHQPLRILMVLAAPTDQEVLELEREANHLREELMRDQGAAGQIELTILNQPGREHLTQAIEQGRFNILHYAGHSNLSMSGGDLYLVSDRTGLTEVLSGDDLAGLLVNNGIRMAVFNSCRGVYTSTSNPNDATEAGNLTAALLSHGVPAVLAMAERIPDDVALTLSRLFYRNLKQRYPIDLSLSRARQGLLSSYGSNQLYWSLPILYLHPDFDGYLQPPLPTQTPSTNGQSSAGTANGHNGQPVIQTSTTQTSDRGTIAASGSASPTVPTNPSRMSDPISDMTRDPVQTPTPFALEGADDVFDELEFDDPEESDREEVLNLLNELRGTPSSNPFAGTSSAEPNTFFDDSTTLRSAEPDAAEPTHTAQDFLNLGEALQVSGDIAGAITAYGEALQLDSLNVDAYSKMGVALEQYDSPAEAIIAYKMALQLDPNHVDAQRHLERLEQAHNLHGEPGSQATAARGSIQGSIATAEPTSPQIDLSLPNDDLPASDATNQRIFAQDLQRRRSQRHPRLVAAGIAGAAVVSGLGLWGLTQGRSLFGDAPSTLLPGIQRINANPNAQPTSAVGNLTAIATTSLAQSDFRKGKEAIETLLNQNNVIPAGEALKAVPQDKLGDPTVSFLRGRVAWQSLQQGNRTVSIEDVRRYWETATSGSQDPQQFNALGFAYYAEGNVKRAIGAWTKAAELAETQQKTRNVVPAGKTNPALQDQLTAYAGLALASVKSANQASGTQQAPLRREGIKLRNRILRQSPTEFQPDALAKNWLWTESAIAEWKALLALK